MAIDLFKVAILLLSKLHVETNNEAYRLEFSVMDTLVTLKYF